MCELLACSLLHLFALCSLVWSRRLCVSCACGCACLLLQVEAEKLSDVTEKFGVSAVPTFVFLHEGKVVDKVEGANGADLASKLGKYAPLVCACMLLQLLRIQLLHYGSVFCVVCAVCMCLFETVPTKCEEFELLLVSLLHDVSCGVQAPTRHFRCVVLRFVWFSCFEVVWQKSIFLLYASCETRFL